MPAASVIVDLLLRTASFETDTKRAEKRIRELEKQFERAGKIIGTAIAGGAVAAVVAFDQLVKGAANFQDLSEMTGASAEGLASLAVAAATAGVSVETVADSAIKLTKSLTGVDDESKAAGAALTALGIPIEEFKALDPVGQIDRLTKAFAGFADGSGKTAVALALWGKTGAEQLKVMKALEEAGGRQTILTQEQIEAADKYADAQAAAMAKLKLHAQAIATEMLPALTALTTAVIEGARGVTDLDKAAKELGGANPVRAFAIEAGRALADFADGLRRVAADTTSFVATTKKEFESLRFVYKAATASPTDLGDFLLRDTGPLKEANDRRKKAIQDAEAATRAVVEFESDKTVKAFDAAVKAQERARTHPALAGGVEPADMRPALAEPKTTKPPKAGAGAKDDPAKRQLENQLRALESVAERERDILQSRNQFLETFNAQGLLSIRSYYEAQRTIIEEATTAQATQIAKQVELLQQAAKKPKIKETEKAELEGKIATLVAQRSKIETEASEKVIALSIRETEEKRRLKIEIEGLNADVLELQGNLAAAASIRFDTTNADLERRLKSESNTAALAQLETLKRSTIAQAEFTSTSTDAARVLETLHQKEESIAIQRQLGVSTELSSQQQLSEARQSTVRELESIVAAQESIATASGDNRLVEQAQRARLELEKLKATAEPLADAFDALFEEAFGDAFADFITGASSAEDAIKKFGATVAREISNIAAQNIAQSLFGKEGALGGLGNLAAGLFGGGGFGRAAAGGGAAAAAAGSAARAPTAAIGAAMAAAGGDTTAAAATAARTAAETASTAAIGANTTAQTAMTQASGIATTAFTTLTTTGTATAVPELLSLAAAAKIATNALAGMATSSSGASGADKAAGIIGTLAGFFTGGADPSFAGVGAAPYDVGGFTGNMPDATVAGVVHGGEFVFSAPTVRRIGVDALDRMHKAAKSGSKVPGFDAGGFVDRLDAMPNAPARDGGGDGGLHYFALGSSGYRDGGPVGGLPPPAGQDRFSSIFSRSTSATTALGGYRVGGAVGGPQTHSASSDRFHSAVSRSASTTALLGYRSGGLVAFRDGTLIGFRDGGLASSSTSSTASSARFSSAVNRSDSTTALLGYRAGGAVLLAVPREARGWREGGHVGGAVPHAIVNRAAGLEPRGFRAGGAVRMLALAESAHPAFREGGAVGAHTHSASSDNYRSALSSATSTSSFAAFRDGGAVRLLAGYREGGAVRMFAATDSSIAPLAALRDGGLVRALAADRGTRALDGFREGGHVRRLLAASDSGARSLRGFRDGGSVAAALLPSAAALPGYRSGGSVRMLAAIDRGAARERGFRDGGHVTFIAAGAGAETAAQAVRGFHDGGFVGRLAAASDAAGAVRGFREGGSVPIVDFSTFRYGGEVPDVQIAAPLFQAGGYVRPGTAAAATPGAPRAPISVTNNFAISGPIDRRTQDQISAATARGLQRSLRNT